MNIMFVAINYITCTESYKSRFEELFASRVKAIDKMPGFKQMYVLKPKEDGDYLIVSHWEKEADFITWTKSPAFVEGHIRGFEDIRKAKEEGREAPMKSKFRTYEIIAD